MEVLINPIEKLHATLQEAIGYDGALKTLDVWANVFGCKPDQTIEVAEGLCDFLKLVKQSKLAVDCIPGDSERFVKPLNTIEKVIRTHNLSTSWTHAKNQLSGSVMMALDFGIHALSIHYPAASPEKTSELRSFIEKLDDLLEECLNSDLSEEMKKLFKKNLERLRSALLDMRISGREAIEDSLDAIVGSLHRNEREINSQSKDGKVFIQKFFDTLGKVNDIVAAYQSITPMIGQAAILALPIIKAAQ